MLNLVLEQCASTEIMFQNESHSDFWVSSNTALTSDKAFAGTAIGFKKPLSDNNLFLGEA